MILRFGNFMLQRAEMLALFIPLILITIILLKMNFLKSKEFHKKRGAYRALMFIFRFVLLAAIVLALSSPAIEYVSVPQDAPKLKILVDNTSSMRIFDTGAIQEFIDALKKQDVMVDVNTLSGADSTNLGDSLLKEVEPNGNILLISDFNSNTGSSLEDVLLFASSVKSKVYGLELKEDNRDAAVSIDGPSKVVSEVENTFKINIQRSGSMGDVQAVVTIDGKEAYNKVTPDASIEIKQAFGIGEHTIKAELLEARDTFPENDIYFKTVQVVKKPKIAYVTGEANPPFLQIVRELYDVDVSSGVPASLDGYYAVIMDNKNAAGLPQDSIDRLSKFLSGENGLLVIGGKDSYDWGDYNQSTIMNLLPVSIGQARKKKDVAHIIIAIDTGVSASQAIPDKEAGGETTLIEIQKALGIDVLDTIADTSHVGVIESNVYPSIVSRPSELGPKKAELKTDIRNLKLHHATAIRGSILTASDLMRLERGSKNLILITDGVIGYYDQVETLKNVKKIYQDGILTFVVGVGENASTGFLQDVADAGGGKYFQTDQVNRLNILFGDQENIPKDKPELFIYNSNHFITKGLNDAGKVTGFNSVFPKASAELLVTTMSGEPVLTVWRYGLGRSAALSTDSGKEWASSLMSKDNSVFLVRTVNWIIGDPERKNNYTIDFPDMTVNNSAVITVKSDVRPRSSDLSFFEDQNNVYKAYYMPQAKGLITLANTTVAVNYQEEYSVLGMNSRAKDIVSISGAELLGMDAKSVADKLKSITKVETTMVNDLTWYFILAATVIYLFELTFRRIMENSWSRRQD